MIKIKIDKSDKLNDRYSAFVSFNYNKTIVEVLRNLPMRYYHADNKCWEIPISKIDVIKGNLSNFDIFIENIEKIPQKTADKIKIPVTYKFKTKPYQHQIDAVEFGLNHDKWFLGDQMGSGKSKQAIDLACVKKMLYNYAHCLIICGVNTLKWNWCGEIHTHSDEQCWILGQKTLKNGKVTIGSSKAKLNDLENIDNLPYFIITNIESFRDKDIVECTKQLCKMDKINMIVLDECHKCKNPQASQTKGFLQLKPETRLAMSGTPLMNNPLDLYVILRWLDCESHSFYQFKQHYCVMGGFGGYEVVGYKNIEQLTEQFNEIKLRRLKEDLFDLPEKTFIDEYIEMSPKQNQLYKEVESNIQVNLSTIAQSLNPLSMLIRLRQVTGYTGIISDTICESAKLDRMIEIVDEAVSNNQKVLIFSNWTQMTDAIYNALNEYGIRGCSCITGETKDEDRQTIVNDFQTKDNYGVLIGTIGALGTGLTITAATVVIFVDEPWNRALYDQAVDRTHRIGQTKNVTIYNLMCKNTIDEKIHNLVYQKGLLSDMIIDGHIVGDKQAVLNYLLS